MTGQDPAEARGRDDDLAALPESRRLGNGAGSDIIDRASVALRHDRGSPAHARAFLRDRLSAWDCGHVLEDVALLTSELVTNAQLHGEPPLAVTVELTPETLRVEVVDGSPEAPVLKDYGIESGTGRGLRMVEGLADSWGTQPAEEGKIVWFEVAV